MMSKPYSPNNITVRVKRDIEQTDEQKKSDAIEKIKLLSERLNQVQDVEVKR